MDATEKLYQEMAALAGEYASAEAERVYLTEFRKSKKAILMKDAECRKPGLSAAAQEREAYASPEYQQLIEGLKWATEKALGCKFKLRQWEMRFEGWRTKQASKRAEMSLR